MKETPKGSPKLRRPSTLPYLFAAIAAPTQESRKSNPQFTPVKPEPMSDEDMSSASRVRSDSALNDIRKRLGSTTSIRTDADNESRRLDSISSIVHPLTKRHSSFQLGVVRPQFGLHHRRQDGFFDIFGIWGVAMVMSFVSAAIALLNQAYIQIFPSAYVNWLMDTEQYDSGDFWLTPDPHPLQKIVSPIVLIAFAMCYIALTAMMTVFRQRLVQRINTASTRRINARARNIPYKKGAPHMSSTSSSSESLSAAPLPELSPTQLARLLIPVMFSPGSAAKRSVTIANASDPATASIQKLKPERRRSRVRTRSIPVSAIYAEFIKPDGVYHAYYDALYDMPKLVIQSVALLAYLRKGFPITLIAFYAAMLTFNWFISFFRFQRKTVDQALIITRFFYLFDLFFAVFAPILVLVYSFYNFHFDRDAFQTKIETLPPGIYDRMARLFADPQEVSVVQLSFSTLLLDNVSYLLTKCALLILSVYKWRKIIVYLIQRNQRYLRQWRADYGIKKSRTQRRHLLLGTSLFLGFGAAIVVYTTGAIITSVQHCAPLDHCAVVSYHWTFEHETCPCLVYINRRVEPRTFDEWESPPDATEELAAAAAMGTLRNIQIINRALPVLPIELRRCKGLEQLILLYSKTEVIPEWTKELTSIRYFHIEGDFRRNLKVLPLTTFEDMKGLQFLHTGVIPRIPQYPSLRGLKKLKSLVIAAPYSMTEFPALDDLESLTALYIVENNHIRRLPSLQHLKKLRLFALFYRAEMCCNGFLSHGQCDLTHFQCLPRPDEIPVECQNDPMPEQDWTLLSQIDATVCTNWTIGLEDVSPTRQATDDVCGGVLYRRCELNGDPGICYNSRMQVVLCDTSGDFERMRRLQIARRVGDPCDPVEEAWLGCYVST